MIFNTQIYKCPSLIMVKLFKNVMTNKFIQQMLNKIIMKHINKVSNASTETWMIGLKKKNKCPAEEMI